MNQRQIAFPIEVRPEEIARKNSLGAAIQLCAELGGHALDKTLQTELGVDKAQFSRWLNDGEGIMWDKLNKLMEVCGNDAPLLWMNHQRGWNIAVMRKLQTETEKELEHERRLRQEAEDKVRFLTQVMQGRVA
jgi:plasmid maintenance system antidote protein VapI